MKNIILLVFTVLILGCNSKKKKEEPISNSHEKNDLSDSPLFNTEIVEPTKLFDNIYFVGYEGVGAFIVNTTQGIILIDAMWTNDDAKNVIIPGIEKLGLNPKDIKYLLVTHEHADHYGGANYIEKTYKSKILMSEVAWNGIHDPNALVLVDPFGNKSSDLPLPQSYQKVDDKEIISLGETNIKVLLTPGHTKGAISLVINTTDNNIDHDVSIWGGTGLPNTLEENKKHLKSLNYFESFAIKNGVDAQISNHPFVNNLLDDMKLLRLRKSTEKNPLILTTEEFKRNIDTALRKSVIEKINSYQ
ncbi:MBL fold metallo-hydrolase [Olleya marilimosa]|uniref:MBL fold metallo-hydrolase n=1 Tax=Olleya marilimosa TaxID=272164 RepID=UPI0004895D97|nr:MBL fold metallo-hydrolase [Olleya marilimosa]